jgi:hypothetical protein
MLPASPTARQGQLSLSGKDHSPCGSDPGSPMLKP